MTALIGYQLLYVVRTRLWVPAVVVHALFLLGYYFIKVNGSAGAYGGAAVGYLLLAVVLTWTVCAGQDPAAWQVMLVSANNRDRAELSRLLVALIVLVPSAVLSVVMAAGTHFGRSSHVVGLFGALLLHAMVAVVGAAIALVLLRHTALRWAVFMLGGLIVGLVLVLVAVA